MLRPTGYRIVSSRSTQTVRQSARLSSMGPPRTGNNSTRGPVGGQVSAAAIRLPDAGARHWFDLHDNGRLKTIESLACS